MTESLTLGLSTYGAQHDEENDPPVTVLVPTINEVKNIDPLLQRILNVATEADIGLEILVVDGGSRDGTQSKVKDWECRGPVRLIESDGRRGLAGDICYAAKMAASEVVVVMDADLSHPAEALPALIRPVLDKTHDMAIGSRYVSGGGTEGWPWWRAVMSKLATALAWPLVSVKDPMSGFFAVKRKRLLELGCESSGFKIALEILSRADDSLAVAEIPISFVDRIDGKSKFGFSVILTYLKQLIILAGGTVSTGNALRFASVGFMGLMIDLLLFNLLLRADIGLIIAHFTSFAAATLFDYTLNSRWAFSETASSRGKGNRYLYFRFLLICILALLLRGAVLGSLVETAGWHPQTAIFLAVAAAGLVNFTGTALFVFPQAFARSTPVIRWRVLAVCIVLYVLLLRLAFAGIIDLIPEEAYYWNYSQHLDIGYLDHPPMVAWLIWLGTHLAGNNEIAVRLPACLCWVVAALYMYRLASNLFDKTTAFRTVMLLAVLPVFFFTGLLMTPDAPLYAAWAGCLYFLQRALLAERRSAWFGVGVCIGIGMLSKYTIALLGPATIVFVVLDQRSRQWFFRPEPYMAIICAAIIFLPVIYWNAENEWVSFAFQGARRWSGDAHVSLHLLLGTALVQISPVGLVAVIISWMSRRTGISIIEARHRLFTIIFTLVPLSIFVLNSLKGAPKLNWTGPVWFAVLPLIAFDMSNQGTQIASRFTEITRRLWNPTLIGMLLFYGGFMYYIQIGMPGLPPDRNMSLPVAWEELGHEVETIEHQLEGETGESPLIVGMDKYFISSQVSFYNFKGDGPQETSGRHLLGENSLMWRYWGTEQTVMGKNILMVDFDRKDLACSKLMGYFAELGPILDQEVKKNGRVLGRFYYRVGYGYHG